MQPNEKKYWFPAKRYGWGWGPPCAWQGWVVTLVWMGLVIGGAVLLAHQRGLFLTYEIVLVTILMIICWIKGEPPHWRWGKD